MNANFFAVLQQRFPADRDTPVLETDDGVVWTYGQLEALSGRYANALSQSGANHGDRVAVQVDKSPETLALYLACLRGGFVHLPLNTAYQPAEIDYFLRDAQPAVFICRPDAREALLPIATDVGVRSVLTLDGEGRGTLPALADLLDAQAVTAEAQPDDLAVILYTSGTTGRSKGAMLTHGNLTSNGLTLVSEWGISSADVLLHALPIFHVHGLFVANHTILLAGGRFLFHRKFDAAAVLRDLQRATLLMGVPTFYTRLLAEPGFTRDTVSGVRLFISGSAPLLTETFEAFETRTGQRILERYGMSESGMITSNPLRGERKAGTVGRPLPDVNVRVADADDHPLSAGAIGGVQIRGPNVFKGYWLMPEKTAQEFTADGWFRTGDVGCFDADGYLSIVGRAKDLIITGGYNVYPKEIELEIDGLPGVVESAVIGVPHPDFGEAVTAVIARKAGTALDEAGILAHLKTRLANYKVPKRLIVVDELPRNTMGKVQKAELRKRYR
ncbi:MAG: malonyl-CoA synthase [Burkholderiales bacterium]|nr:malonyl-CoA synthase [Burkholderiales bacterium]